MTHPKKKRSKLKPPGFPIFVLMVNCSSLMSFHLSFIVSLGHCSGAKIDALFVKIGDECCVTDIEIV